MFDGADPLASLRAWELEVELADRTFVVPSAMSNVWLPILMAEPLDLAEVIPGMLSDADQETLEEALMDGLVSARDVSDLALEVITEAAGRPWWWTLRLLHAASGAWLHVWGSLVAAGVNPQVMSLGAMLDAIYATMLPRGQVREEVRRQFDRELAAPPPGVKQEIDEDREAAAFLAMMNGGI